MTTTRSTCRPFQAIAPVLEVCIYVLVRCSPMLLPCWTTLYCYSIITLLSIYAVSVAGIWMSNWETGGYCRWCSDAKRRHVLVAKHRIYIHLAYRYSWYFLISWMVYEFMRRPGLLCDNVQPPIVLWVRFFNPFVLGDWKELQVCWIFQRFICSLMSVWLRVYLCTSSIFLIQSHLCKL